MAEALGPQDCLYALVTRDRHSTTVRVIGSIVDYVLARPDLATAGRTPRAARRLASCR